MKSEKIKNSIEPYVSTWFERNDFSKQTGRKPTDKEWLKLLDEFNDYCGNTIQETVDDLIIDFMLEQKVN